MNTIHKILIIEDEPVAASQLRRLLANLMPQAEVIAILQSIEETVEFFTDNNQQPSLCFMDIHLADGSAFRIFDKVNIPCPIIFTTAYDQYALDSFKVNSIDYLLKPINPDDLKRAIDKLKHLTSQPQVEKLAEAMRTYSSHFLIPMRDKLIPLETRQIACLYLEDKMTRAILLNGRQHTLDHPLDAIMGQLDPGLFFRANRQYIVQRNAIKEISLWPIGKLALTLEVDTPDKIIVSKAKAGEFKQWFTK